MFSRVDMGRWFGAPSDLTDNEVKRRCCPQSLPSGLTRMPLYHVELLIAGDLL
jgi:hypothetical protein